MKWEIFSQNKTFSSDSDLDFLHSSWHSLPAFNKVCSGSYQAKPLSVPLPSLIFSCSWCHWPDPFPRVFFPFSDSDVFCITFCGLVTLLSYFESHLSQFITFCHILNHILSSYDCPPSFCEGATNTCPWSTSTRFLLVSCYCYPQIQIYLIMSYLCWWVTDLPAYSRTFWFHPNGGLGLLFWQVWLASRYRLKPAPKHD